jgi:hypothetical protein
MSSRKRIEYTVIKDIGTCFTDHVWICGFRQEWKAKLVVWFMKKYRVDKVHNIYYIVSRVRR